MLILKIMMKIKLNLREPNGSRVGFSMLVSMPAHDPLKHKTLVSYYPTRVYESGI